MKAKPQTWYAWFVRQCDLSDRPLNKKTQYILIANLFPKKQTIIKRWENKKFDKPILNMLEKNITAIRRIASEKGIPVTFRNFYTDTYDKEFTNYCTAYTNDKAAAGILLKRYNTEIRLLS
jgi:hypothetical protein